MHLRNPSHHLHALQRVVDGALTRVRRVVVVNVRVQIVDSTPSELPLHSTVYHGFPPWNTAQTSSTHGTWLISPSYLLKAHMKKTQRRQDRDLSVVERLRCAPTLWDQALNPLLKTHRYYVCGYHHRILVRQYRRPSIIRRLHFTTFFPSSPHKLVMTLDDAFMTTTSNVSFRSQRTIYTLHNSNDSRRQSNFSGSNHLDQHIHNLKTVCILPTFNLHF